MLEITPNNALYWSRLNSRVTFGLALCELAKENNNIVVVAADVAHSAGLEEFASLFPDRFFNAGIAEQNMIGIASGLASEGYTVFATSFAPFASMRCFEPIRQYIGYMHLNVKVVGIASGLSMGVGGNTHYGLEDIALMRTIPGMTILSPADCSETVQAMKTATVHKGPLYLRLTGIGGNPVVYKEPYDFIIGKPIQLTKGSDVAILATGTMVNESLRTTRVLSKKNISATVLDMHTLKPVNAEYVKSLYATHQLLVTIEEHSVIGGLGSAIAEIVSVLPGEHRQLSIGLPDTFHLAGDYSYMLASNNLTARQIADSIINALGR